MLDLDEHAEELHNVFDSTSGVHFDPELLSASTKVGIDLMNRLEVYRKRPRSWATDKGLHVDVNKTDAERPDHRSRLCGKEIKRWDPTMPGTFALMGPFECVLFADVEKRSKMCDGSQDLVLGCFEGTL